MNTRIYFIKFGKPLNNATLNLQEKSGLLEANQYIKYLLETQDLQQCGSVKICGL